MQMGIKDFFIGLQDLCNMDFECFFWTMLFMVHVWSIHLCFAFLWVGIEFFLCLFMTPF